MNDEQRTISLQLEQARVSHGAFKAQNVNQVSGELLMPRTRSRAATIASGSQPSVLPMRTYYSASHHDTPTTKGGDRMRLSSFQTNQNHSYVDIDTSSGLMSSIMIKMPKSCRRFIRRFITVPGCLSTEHLSTESPNAGCPVNRMLTICPPNTGMLAVLST